MAAIDPMRLLSHIFPDWMFKYSPRDVALYNLSIGACARDGVDSDEIKYVYHYMGQQFIQVLPTYASMLATTVNRIGRKIPGLPFDENKLLQARRYIELYKPLPSSAILRNTVTITELHDKGTAALFELENRSFDISSGELLCMNRITYVIPAAGRFSKTSQPYSYCPNTPTPYPNPEIPKYEPVGAYEDQTQQSQALLFAINGEYNPVHSDLMVAATAGYSRPILQASCVMGFAVRAIIKVLCSGDHKLIKTISCLFLSHVYPGETLITEMWIISTSCRVIYQTKVKERNIAVLSGHVDIPIPQ